MPWQVVGRGPRAAAHGLAGSLRAAASRSNGEAESGWLPPKPGEGEGDSEAHAAARGWLRLSTHLRAAGLRGRASVSARSPCGKNVTVRVK